MKVPVSRGNRELGRQLCAASTSLIHPLRLSVCTCTSVCPDACIYNVEVLSMCNKHVMLGQTAVIYTHTYTLTHIQHFHSSTVLCKQPQETRTLTEAMKDRQKCRLAGPTTGYSAQKESCIQEKQRVRDTAVRYTKKSKRTTNVHI